MIAGCHLVVMEVGGLTKAPMSAVTVFLLHPARGRVQLEITRMTTYSSTAVYSTREVSR